MFRSFVLAASMFLACAAQAGIHFYSIDKAFDCKLEQQEREDGTPFKSQEQNRWCWAASVQSAYAAQGAHITQAEIVKAIKGVVINETGQPREIAAALTGIGHDDDGKLFTANCVVLLKRGNAFVDVSTNKPFAPPSLVLTLSHGIPAILGYHNETTPGHAVLISGMSIDDETHIQHFQIEDPWPLDENGTPLSNGEAVRKQVSADLVYRDGMMMILPIIVTDDNHEQMKTMLSNFSVLAQQVMQGTFSLDSLDELTGTGVDKQIFEGVGELKESMKVQSDWIEDGDDSDDEARDAITLDDEDLEWHKTQDDPTVRFKLTFKNNSDRPVECRFTVACGEQNRDDEASDHSSWEETSHKEFKATIKPDGTKVVRGTLRWTRKDDTQPVVRYWTGDADEDGEYLHAKFKGPKPQEADEER